MKTKNNSLTMGFFKSTNDDGMNFEFLKGQNLMTNNLCKKLRREGLLPKYLKMLVVAQFGDILSSNGLGMGQMLELKFDNGSHYNIYLISNHFKESPKYDKNYVFWIDENEMRNVSMNPNDIDKDFMKI